MAKTCCFQLLFSTILCLLQISNLALSQEQSTQLAALMTNLANLQSSELILIAGNTTTNELSLMYLIHDVFEDNLVPISAYDVLGTNSFPKNDCQDNPIKESEHSVDNRRPKVFFIIVQDISSLKIALKNLLSTVINCPGKQDGGYFRNENIIAFYGIAQEEAYKYVFQTYETKRHPHIGVFNKFSRNNGFLMSRYDLYTNSIINLSVWKARVHEYKTIRSLFPWMDMKGYRLQVSSIPYSYLVYEDTVQSPNHSTKPYKDYIGYHVSFSQQFILISVHAVCLVL